ncbi:J domain-containing protein [Microcystis elabens FACHB-917]|nr:J domain-containing protein [Microcystis elabens FACHB-917]
MQQIEFIAQDKELRFYCENGQFNIARSAFLRIEHISADSMCIHCSDFLVRINGYNAAIEIDAIDRFAKRHFFTEDAGYKRRDTKNSGAQDILGYYSVLGVEPNSTQELIRKAYKKKCLEVHPDVNKLDNAHESFVQLQKAYEILGNAEERSKYDAQCIEVPSVKSSTVNDTTESDNTFEPMRCSICNCVSAQPRYVVFWETISFFSSIRSPVQGVMCTKCAGNAALQATRKSLIFGWWGIWGLIFTPMSVIGNMAGGSKPPENNGRILLHQSWYFLQNGRLDLAYLLADDAHKYLKATLNKEVASLLSICQSIMENCKPFADGKRFDHVWDRALPRLGDQWKAVGMCAIAWTIGLTALNGYLEGQRQKAIEGAPKYTYQTKETTSPPAATPSISKPVEAEPPPIPPTYLPLSTGYLPGKQVADSDGYSEVTLKNNSDSNFHVRLYRKDGSAWVISREVYLKADEEFTMEDLIPGAYEIRRMDVQTKTASKTEAFTLEETKNSEGVRYSTMTLTLDVVQGNSKIVPITAKEF